MTLPPRGPVPSVRAGVGLAGAGVSWSVVGHPLEERPRFHAEGFGEGFERRDLDGTHVVFFDELVYRRRRKTRLLREAVRRPAALHHEVFHSPSDAHAIEDTAIVRTGQVDTVDTIFHGVHYRGLTMARNGGMRARFFVCVDGTVRERARGLNRSQKIPVFRRDRFTCRYCGARVVAGAYIDSHMRALGIRKANIDHVLPIARGGQNDDANLVTACVWCNSSKGADRALPSLTSAEG